MSPLGFFFPMADYDKILAQGSRKPLSSGLYGQTFLVEDKYVIKQQRYLDSESDPFHKESVIYRWIDKLPQRWMHSMFCHLLSFRFIHPCDLPRRYTKLLQGTRLDQIRQLNEAPKCVEMLLEHKGIPFDSWLKRNMPHSKSQIYYLMRQLVMLHLLMYQGGFYHNDLHFENVLVSHGPSDIKEASLMWNKKSYSCKIQPKLILVAIDYGEVSAVGKDKTKSERRLLDDMRESIADLLLKRYAYNNKTDIAGEKQIALSETVIVFPPRVIKGIKKVLQSYRDVFVRAKQNAMQLNPEYESIFEAIEKNVHYLETNADEMVRKAIRHVQHELQLAHPEVFAKLFDNTTFYKKTLLPREEVRTLLMSLSISELLDRLYNKN
jgi:hypothetical protein